jgi:hypothetical protein
MMTPETFQKELRTLLDRQPFHPFLIELEAGGPWRVDRREAIQYNVGKNAVYIHDGDFDFVECENVRRFVDQEPASST